MKTIIQDLLTLRLTLLMVLSIFLFSCEDQIDVTLDEGETLLVVDGWITDQAGPHTVVLSTTAPYFNDNATPRVSGAEVTITDSDGNQEILTETQAGHYITRSEFQGKVGHQYYLHIRVDGQQYQAQTQIRRPLMIDSLSQKFREKSMAWKKGYYVLYNGPEQPGIGDNFRFKLYKNDALLNKTENLVVAQDKYVDGNYIKEVELHNEPFQKGDRIRVETWSITEDAYYYYQEMIQQLNNGGLFANPPANIRTNIVNLHPERQKRAAGYFGGASVRSKELLIK